MLFSINQITGQHCNLRQKEQGKKLVLVHFKVYIGIEELRTIMNKLSKGSKCATET